MRRYEVLLFVLTVILLIVIAIIFLSITGCTVRTYDPLLVSTNRVVLCDNNMLEVITSALKP